MPCLPTVKQCLEAAALVSITLHVCSAASSLTTRGQLNSSTSSSLDRGRRPAALSLTQVGYNTSHFTGLILFETHQCLRAVHTLKDTHNHTHTHIYTHTHTHTAPEWLLLEQTMLDKYQLQ